MPHILIIDDDPKLRQFLRLVLERNGHTTAEAGDGAEAIRLCESGGIDLALCDILMPGREGLETIREFRQRFPQLRVIAMSGGISGLMMDPLRIAACLGACRTISKPFRVEAILQLVNEVLSEPPAGERRPTSPSRQNEELIR